MPSFAELDWSRPDVLAIVQFGGVLTLLEQDRDAHRSWCRCAGYAVQTLDAGAGWERFIAEHNELLAWPASFGYTLTPENFNLDALRDGFWLPPTESGGQVLEWLGADVLAARHLDLVLGWLAIASEYSRCELALGRRFYIALVVPPDSSLVGCLIERQTVPFPASSALFASPG